MNKFKQIKQQFEQKNNIIRVKKNRENPYVMIYKKSLGDENLSWAAKGLYAYLLSLPDDWDIYVSELLKHTSSGRDHTYTVIKELLKNGYMEKLQYRCEGKVIGVSYTVFEESTGTDNSETKIVGISINEFGQIVETPIAKPNTENPYTVKPNTDSTKLLNTNSNNNNSTKKDVVDVVAQPPKELLDLYKSFKLEKRVMPHTVKLLSEYASKFELDVFEQVFISASGDNIKSKYAYIKKVFSSLSEKNIVTLDDYNKEQEKFKSSKTAKTSADAPVQSKKKVTSIYHDTFNEHFSQYTENELESNLRRSKASNDDFRHQLYEAALEDGLSSFSAINQQQVINYCKENGLEVPA